MSKKPKSNESRPTGLAAAPCSAVPSVALPLKLRQRGNDAWIEDAHGREAVSRTCGFASGQAHENWLRWIVCTANATLKPNAPGEPDGGSPKA